MGSPLKRKKNLAINKQYVKYETIDDRMDIPEEDKGEWRVLQMEYGLSKLAVQVNATEEEDALTDKEDNLAYLQFPIIKPKVVVEDKPSKIIPSDRGSVQVSEDASAQISVCDNPNDITLNNILLPIYTDLDPQMTFGNSHRTFKSSCLKTKDKEISEDLNDSSNQNETDIVSIEGTVWIMKKKDQVVKKWSVLFNKSLYLYKDQHDEFYEKIYYLSSLFVKEDTEDCFDNNKRALRLSLNGKEKLVLFESDEQKDIWMMALKKIEKKSNVNLFYNFEGIIGKGSFGLVKKAYKVLTKEPVAIKIINKNETTAGLGILKMEIECMRLCKHPNICQLHEIYETEDCLFLVTEYLEGGNLRNYIKMNTGNISEKKIKQIFASLVSAVYYMQKIGIMHRDLKPENILLTDKTENSDVKILDFGLATVKGPNQFSKEKVGTISYIAPEIHEGKPYDKAVDIWSLGIILYFLLSGKLPFEGEAEKDKIR